jgi:hypothetical protein
VYFQVKEVVIVSGARTAIGDSDFLIPYGKTAPFKENKLAHFSGLL